MLFEKHQLPSEESALKGRDRAIEVPAEHFVNGHAIVPPFPGSLEVIYVGMGCFWGLKGCSGSRKVSGQRQ